jgi:hypothetical protein
VIHLRELPIGKDLCIVHRLFENLTLAMRFCGIGVFEFTLITTGCVLRERSTVGIQMQRCRLISFRPERQVHLILVQYE